LTASNLQEKVKRQKAITNSESKILKLRDSLIVIEMDNSKQIQENEDSKDSLIQLSSKNDALIAECARLKAKNAKTETDFNARVEDAIRNQNLLKQACDEVIINEFFTDTSTHLHEAYNSINNHRKFLKCGRNT
jgi:TolA-binding protein